LKDKNNITDDERQDIKDKMDDVVNGKFYKKLIVKDDANTISYTITKDNYEYISKVLFDDKLKVVVEDIEESIEIPFAVIENVPIPTSCENLASNDERKTCMINFITSHVNKNFNTNIANENGLTGQMRIQVIFKINKEGHVVEVQSRAPHTAIETEAKRVVNSLPKFIPGTQKGKAVVVPYSLPILFKVNSDKQTETDKTLKEMNELASLHKNAIPFSTI